MITKLATQVRKDDKLTKTQLAKLVGGTILGGAASEAVAIPIGHAVKMKGFPGLGQALVHGASIGGMWGTGNHLFKKYKKQNKLNNKK